MSAKCSDFNWKLDFVQPVS